MTVALSKMLAVTDAVYLVACIFIQTLECIVKQTDWLTSVVNRYYWPYVEVCAWPMASVAIMATVWMVVVLTVHRYVAICRPLHAAQYNTMAHVRKAVAAVWIFAVVYNLPRFFEREVVAKTVVPWIPAETPATSPDFTSSSDFVQITSPNSTSFTINHDSKQRLWDNTSDILMELIHKSHIHRSMVDTGSPLYSLWSITRFISFVFRFSFLHRGAVTADRK